MPKLPVLNYTQLIKKVKKAGFVFERQGKGSHEFWVNYETKRIVMVPRHPAKNHSDRDIKKHHQGIRTQC